MTPADSPSPATLLLVEPDEQSSRAIQAKLSAEGHRIIVAESESQAIAAAIDTPPHVVLFAPSRFAPDRLSFISRIRGVDALSFIPMIVLSHDLTDAELITAMERGATDFILRPFHVAEIRARVRSAIRMSRLLRLLEHRARIDPLTGLWNRLYFSERLAGAIASANRTGDSLAVVIIDIDYFKRINDTFGHATGDAVLQNFAALLRRSVRAADTACRYGGEEFAIIMPDASAENATLFCDRFRALLAAAQWPAPIATPISASFGITTVGLHLEAHLEAWVEAADRALYAAKAAGRDRAHIFDPATGHSPPAMRLAG